MPDQQPQGLKFLPLTPERWLDFQTLFGPNGACGGCWCMNWRISRAEYELSKGEGNKKLMKGLVSSGKTPGIIGYVGNKPVSWCSIAPRGDFPSLARSRILKTIDEKPVWSVSCFFIAKPFRGQGLSNATLKAAIKFAVEQGAQIIEGYPIEPKKKPMPSVFAWVGFASTFKAVGFEECARRSQTRPIMRLYTKNALQQHKSSRPRNHSMLFDRLICALA